LKVGLGVTKADTVCNRENSSNKDTVDASFIFLLKICGDGNN
jgi:hypothetical protein